ncbi:MAG: ParB N-terminal domain-containing protein [Phycisphaerales bacterium]
MKRKNLYLFLLLFVFTAILTIVYFKIPGIDTNLYLKNICLITIFSSLILMLLNLLIFLISLYITARKKPDIEIKMLSRPVKLAAAIGIFLTIVFFLGKLNAFFGFFSIFGGLLLGMSLQSPMSGLVAWIMISIKRSIRPGDRIQFPNLNLTGDVEDVGAMYLALNQVGGSIASEEAVGRRVLMPNAMLFSNVAINYTVSQNAAYILDEVVVRITYNSDWEKAEEILLNAAHEVTADIIKITGIKPYIRSTLYDYGVYLRLRFKTRVKDRPEIAYNIEKRIFETIQKTPSVDIAIPYVYSYRAATDESFKMNNNINNGSKNIMQINLETIRSKMKDIDVDDIKQIAESVLEKGLLQPIIVERKKDHYEVVAGHLRLEACKYLGWKEIDAVLAN